MVPAQAAWLAAGWDGPLQVDQTSFKPHCGAKQGLAAVHAMQQILAQDGVAPADVARVEVGVPQAYAAMLDREPGATSRLASMVSAPWQLALTALRPTGLDGVERDAAPDPAVSAWAARVTVHHDTSLDAHYPARWPARVRVFAAGQMHERLVLDSPGDPSFRWGDAELLDKAARILQHPSDRALVAQALRGFSNPQALAPSPSPSPSPQET